jgi:hypothetical protein
MYAVSQNAIHVSFWLLGSGVVALLVLRWRESALEKVEGQAKRN